jgi:hypothetical protein
MKPLMIGPDGLVESATRRETAHLTHYLGHGQTCKPTKARNKQWKNIAAANPGLDSSASLMADSMSPMPSRTAAGASMKNCPLCKSLVREDRMQKHLSTRCPSRPSLDSSSPPLAEKSMIAIRVSDQRPCSCGGSNENCTQCYGRGFIEGHSESRSKSSASPTPSSTRPVVKCPACEFKGATDEFTRHFALAHGTKGRLRRRIQVPLVCIAERFDTAVVGKARRKAGTRSAMKNCSLCNSQVREDRLQKHMSSRCAVRPNKPPVQVARASQRIKKSQHAAENSAPESVRQKGTIEVERPSWSDNLDATKNCGYPAREEGRYGSYPSHDGFDDESKP